MNPSHFVFLSSVVLSACGSPLATPSQTSQPAPTHIICGTNGVIKEHATPIPSGTRDPISYLHGLGIRAFELFDSPTTPQANGGFVEAGELVAALGEHSSGRSKIHFSRPRSAIVWISMTALCPLPSR